MTKSTITREPITHDLKIYPEFFSAVCTGVKRAELRKNDRDYRVGDTLHLMETPRGSCHQTGEFINVKITHIADVGEWMPGYVLLSVELQERRKADSEPVELPRDYLQGHKDGLEWASQLAEANHPETGDWLYDDPIELAKAIRKGPDMPPVQPVADSEPVAWTWQHLKQWYVTNDEERARELAWDGVKVEQLYRHAQPAVDSEFIPKNLDKALGVLGMAIPESREEFNFQTERWIQRLIDRVIRYADEFQEQPASVVQCPYPCGWDNLNKLAIQDAALVARGLVEGEPITDAQRQAAISNNDRLLKVISACRAAMLSGGKP
ncbi:DUF3850 domain-containing protein [Klebsiella pneumoniae]|uniref:DUF3850 domain-containing protein n=1 Tax=Klebsiella pneumoniae TaxID=573 RepID=UPI004046812B